MTYPRMKLLSALIVLAFSGPVGAATYTDNFQGASANLSWALGTPASGTNAACLTAGNGTGSIPACTSNTDTVGNGALRLTPASGNSFGNIVSSFPPFPSNQGLQVTFTTYTYGGDKGGTAQNGADGIGFFLMDGSVAANIGATGGSLGYSCSNTNTDSNGLIGGYLGLGIDEYGNFLNSGDNTSTGIINSNDPAYTGGTTHGSNSYTNGSKYYQPQRIGLRGAGNVSWPWLQANYPLAFTGAFNSTKVKNVCSTGQFSNPVAMAFPGGTNLSSINYTWLRSNYSSYYPKTSSINSTQQSQAVAYAQQNQIWDFSSPSSPVQVFTNQTVTVPNYAAIPGGYRLLPNGSPIANENTSTRANAWPITYKLTITPAGYLSFSYSYNNGVYQPVLSNQLITTSNGPLPSTFKFGFSGSTGGSTNVHEITCFTAQPIQSSSSAAANTIQSGQVQTGTQIYLAYYNSNNWWGGLTSNNLVVSSSGTVSAATTANWDAGCNLTGGACTSTGASATLLTPANRQLLTWDGSAGTAFTSSNLTAIQTGILNGNTTGSSAADLVSWLRGDRTNEQGQSTGTGALRLRSSVLGDIVNSSPVWVGAPVASYSSQFNDAIYGASTPENATGAQTYTTYAQNNATRANVVYSGANDGFLHGFRSGSYNTNGTYNSGNNDGQEVLGFMPYGVLANITGGSPASINNLANPTYSHNYFVDATPASGDLFYNGTWHTWLVGGLGSGGKEIYALDITDPTQFSQTHASSLVMGDWTADSTSEQTAISCANASGCNANLGYTNGTPLIRRLHNGKWAVIFGNGLNSSTGRAGVYIGLVNSTSGSNPPTFTFYWLDTGTGSTSSPDGINYVTSADLDGDKITDYLYGGDAQGNVWRFDLTSSNPADWGVSKYGNTTATPLFTAKISGVAQPITTQLSTAWTNVAGQKQVMIMFGTGQKIQATATTPDVYATGTQSVYGIWDWDMAAWNNGTTTTSGVAIPSSGTPYRALTGPQTTSRSDLQSQTATTLSMSPPTGSQIQGYRTTSATAVCWNGTSTCTAGNTRYGWYLDLPTSQEQVVYNPVINNGALILNTTIPPSTSSTSSCSVPTTTGWTMAFNIATGGSFPQSFFQNASGNFSVGSGGSSISGIQLGGVGSTGFVSVGSQQYTYFQTSTSQPAVAAANFQNGIIPSRVMWEQLR